MELEFHENRFNDSHTLHNGVNELTDWFWRKSVLWKPYFTLFGKGNANLRESNVLAQHREYFEALDYNSYQVLKG